jgi:hypothetical protein
VPGLPPSGQRMMRPFRTNTTTELPIKRHKVDASIAWKNWLIFLSTAERQVQAEHANTTAPLD